MRKPRPCRPVRLLELPPLPHAAAHRKLLERLAQMSVDEVFETIIRAGIVTRDGKLTKPYRTPRDAASAAK